MSAHEFLEDLLTRAIAAAHPATCLPRHLPAAPAQGRLILLAAGKAAGSMIEVAEAHYLDAAKFPASRLSGVAVARHGYGRPTRVVPMIEAGHPIPDAAGLESAAAGVAMWIPVFPVDTVKSRLQSAAGSPTLGGVVRELYSKGGVRAFFPGMAPALARAVPANAATFLGVELAQQAMSKMLD